MILRYNDFIVEKMGYPDSIEFYVQAIYKYCLEELDKYMKFSGRWYSYKKSFYVSFDVEEKNKDFPVNRVDIDFLISVKKKNIHEFGSAGFYPYVKDRDIKEDGVNVDLQIELCIQSDRESVNLHIFKLELMKAIRHEMLHAYESYKKEILKSKPDNIWMSDFHMMNKDFTLGSQSLVDFLYLLYFTQAGERNAHIAQTFKGHYDDVNDAIDKLINFSYLKEYLKILKEIKDNGYTEDDLTHIVRKLVSDYNDFCEDHNIEPLPKMVKLENKGLLKWMKHFDRIFKDQGLKMKKRLGKRIVESLSFRRKKDIKRELLKYGIANCKINDDESIDVYGNVNLYKSVYINEHDYIKLDKIPFKFGKVTGNFDIRGNNLTSLEGCPYYVGGYFNCSENKLTSLEGSPNEVGGDFYCHNNRIESLEGMTLEIGNGFYCTGNKFKELNSLSNIEGTIYCDENIDTTKFLGYCKNIIKC